MFVCSFNLAAVIDSIEKTRGKIEQTLDLAFSDLDQLMEKAGELVKLAEQLSKKLAMLSEVEPADAAAIDDKVMFQKLIQEIGVAQPVTKETSGNVYHQELAKQLCEFLSALSKRNGANILTLADIYCFFNRARGVCKSNLI